MEKKNPHKHGNVMSLGCLDRVLGCVELYGEFFNICECLSLWNGACGPRVHLEPKGRTFRAKSAKSSKTTCRETHNAMLYTFSRAYTLLPAIKWNL